MTGLVDGGVVLADEVSLRTRGALGGSPTALHPQLAHVAGTNA